MTVTPWNEGVTPGHPLTLLGQVVSRDANDIATYGALQVIGIPGSTPGTDTLPLSPTLSGTQPSRTAVNLSWVAADSSGRPTVTSWQVQRRASTDGGTTSGPWADITGSPFAGATTTVAQTGLATGTPEVIYDYRVLGINGDGAGTWSNIFRTQWATVVVQPPTAPTGLSMVGKTSTTKSLAWAMSNNASVDKLGIFDDGVLVRDNIPVGTTFTWTGLTPGAQYTNIGIARHNSGGWSPVSNLLTFYQPLTDATFVYGPQMMGCSSSDNSHGGTEVWEGWRTYTEGTMLSLANRNTTAQPRPKFLAYSKGGQNLGGTNPTYAAVYAEALGDLNDFYYSGTGQTRSARWGIKLFWANGNENSVKGCLDPAAVPDQAQRISLYSASQKALYDACHYIDPVTGTRRFPDAYAGSNPTQNHEQSGVVEYWLHPTARYHDFVMWSMYDPGRKATVNDPTFNWSSLSESSRTNGQQGSLIRCFYRTNAARAAAQTADPGHQIVIGMGEGANGVDPDDVNTRPYWAVHAFAGGMAKLSDLYNLEMPFACWWDNDTDTSAAGSGSDGRSTLEYDYRNRTWATNTTGQTPSPTTREAWQNWRSFNHEFGGTHPPSWAGLPKSTWKTNGTVV